MRRIAFAFAAASITTIGWLGVTPTVASADPQTQTFAVPGALDWPVPAGVQCVTFDVYGADGGDGGDFLLGEELPKGLGGGVGGLGGLGGRATATIQVTPGETIVVSVGFNGDAGSDENDGGTGGIVGGGNGGSGEGSGGGGGGGASDVRRGGSALANRVIVGGGGGGGGAGGPDGAGADGGAGGNPGSKGDDGLPVVDQGDGQGLGGGGGTATNGGAAGGQVGFNQPGFVPATAGSSGQGGAGASDGDGGGGGGGGFYGGGGGGAGFGTSGAGGGGGSSIAPGPATFQNGIGADNEGDGKIIVSWTPGNTSCLAAPPVITNPNFTG